MGCFWVGSFWSAATLGAWGHTILTPVSPRFVAGFLVGRSSFGVVFCGLFLVGRDAWCMGSHHFDPGQPTFLWTVFWSAATLGAKGHTILTPQARGGQSPLSEPSIALAGPADDWDAPAFPPCRFGASIAIVPPRCHSFRH